MNKRINQQLSKKNFFYSADSEHYQDAVLTYIFYNYPESGKNDDELSEIERFSKYFTRLFLGNSEHDITITNVEVETQVFDSDIDLIVHTDDGKDHLVIIEDKTGSAIHRSVKKSKDGNSKTLYYETQLEKYYDKFLHEPKYQEYFKEGRVHLFYYKNEYVNSFEKRRLEIAKEGCKKILCAPFNDQISEIRKEIKKLKNDGKNHKDSTFEQREIAIQELEKKNMEYASYFDTYGYSIVEWKMRNIDWIFDAFDSFSKDNEFENLILREYFESINFWKNEIDKILAADYTIERSSGDDKKWGDRSKLWNPVFCQMVERSLEQIKYVPYDTKVQKYNGKYWEMSIHSKDKKTCMIASAKGIANDSFTIGINLRNKKYDGEDNVPAEWNLIDGQRENDGNKIIDTIKNVMNDDANLTLGSKMKKSGQDNNKICSYKFVFKPGEKPDYDTLFKYWMKALEVFVTKIDGIQ